MIRSVLGKAVSRGSAILNSLHEDDRADPSGSDENSDLYTSRLIFSEDVEVDTCESCGALRGKVAKLQRMVVSLEHSLEEERATNKETSEKLSLAVTESTTIDSLVDEYSKLSREAARQADEDAQRIAELLARDEEQRAKLQIFEAQIMSLTEADDAKISELVASGAVYTRRPLSVSNIQFRYISKHPRLESTLRFRWIRRAFLQPCAQQRRTTLSLNSS